MQLDPEIWEQTQLTLKSKVLNLHANDFEAIALEVFQYQYAFNPLYQTYVKMMNISIEDVNEIHQIPFLPIELFKNYQVQTGFAKILFNFESSGTTGQIPSKHPVCDPIFYQHISKRIFEEKYGELQQFHIFALLPSYLERSTSSLVFMMDHFIKESKSELSGFYLNQYEELTLNIKKALETERKIWLIGVTFGLLDWIDSGQDFAFWKEAIENDRIMIMETGGMKGRREEWIRDRVHDFMKEKMGATKIASEYGMTELFSQAYATMDGIFSPGFSMRVLLREVTDPFSNITQKHKVGGIKVIDLANIDSCSFIETKDLGSLEVDGSHFKVLGRFDNSEIRGCNLMAI
ncbi:acyl transferase [Aquirufa sp. ROCK-SH2]